MRWVRGAYAAILAGLLLLAVGCARGADPVESPDSAPDTVTDTSPADDTPQDVGGQEAAPEEEEPDESPGDHEPAADSPPSLPLDVPEPDPPTTDILKRPAGELIEWFVQLERWMQAAVLVPNQLAEEGKAADEAVRNEVIAALARFYTPQYAEDLLQTFWVEEDAAGEKSYRLLETEGPALLPYMETIEILEVAESHVTLRATNPPPALWEDLTLQYELEWVDGDGEATFRIRDIMPQGS